MAPRPSSKGLALLMGSTVLLSGCSSFFYTGHPIDRTVMESFKDVGTTVDQVRAALGQPDSITENTLDHTVSYSYQNLRNSSVTVFPFIRTANSGDVLDIVFKDDGVISHRWTRIDNHLIENGHREPRHPTPAVATVQAPHETTRNAEDRYGLYTADMDGKNELLLLSNPLRQMTHPRLSPDGRWVTFTRYNNKGAGGYADEVNGYENTEIAIVRIDGSGERVIVPPRPDRLAANSSWLSDGKRLLYIATEGRGQPPKIRIVHVDTGQTTEVLTPPGVAPSDPHQIGDLFVFPQINTTPNRLWIMKPDGSNARVLTQPVFQESRRPKSFALGDYDPRISPDRKHIAFMRYFGGEEWHVLVIDVRSGKEQDLSAAGATDFVPNWAPDGQSIVFAHADRKNLRAVGLWTVRRDGTHREQISLPRGRMYFHVEIHLDAGSKHNRLLYSATRNENIP